MGNPRQLAPAATIEYDRAKLDHLLSEVSRYLGELIYIDRTLTYLDGRDDPRAYATEPWAVMPHEQYDIEVGETFPFTRTIRVLDPRVDPDFEIGEGDPSGDSYEQIVYDILGIKVWATTWARDNLVSLTEAMKEITHSVPAIYEDSVVAPLQTAHITLQDAVRTDLGKLGHSIRRWTGDAAANFATGFYDQFGDMRLSQEHLVAALVGGVATAKAIDESAQHSLMNAVHYLRELLREQLAQRQQLGNAAQQDRDANLTSSATTIAVLAGGASVFSAAVGSALWAITFEAASAGLSVAATGIPAEAIQELELQGQTAEGLLNALDDAIREITRNMSSQYGALERELDGVLLPRVRILREGPDGDDGRLFPDLPQIVEGVDSDTFRHYPDGSPLEDA